MQLYIQMSFKNSPKDYLHLKENSYYIKDFNRGVIDFKSFQDKMNAVYKERVTDKISNVVENIDLISSVLNVLK